MKKKKRKGKSRRLLLYVGGEIEKVRKGDSTSIPYWGEKGTGPSHGEKKRGRGVGKKNGSVPEKKKKGGEDRLLPGRKKL